MYSDHQGSKQSYFIHTLLNSFKGGLVASCQPVRGGALDRPDIVAAMAQACVDGGALGLRIEGIADLKAVVTRVQVPIVGIVKRQLDDSPVCITPYVADVVALAQAGAHVIAVDATHRKRPVPIKELLQAIHAQGRVAMADCSQLADAEQAHAMGFDIIGTTLSGYTGHEVPAEPDWHFLAQSVRAGFCTMAEGRYSTPAYAQRALEMGAWSVTVGTALTRIEHMTADFVSALSRSDRRSTDQP